MQAITAALPKLREWAPPHVHVGASANGFKTSTTEWLGGGTTPGMVVPDGMLCSQTVDTMAVNNQNMQRPVKDVLAQIRNLGASHCIALGCCSCVGILT